MILWTIPLNPGRFPRIVHSGCIFAYLASKYHKKFPGIKEKEPDKDNLHPA